MPDGRVTPFAAEAAFSGALLFPRKSLHGARQAGPGLLIRQQRPPRINSKGNHLSSSLAEGITGRFSAHRYRLPGRSRLPRTGVPLRNRNGHWQGVLGIPGPSEKGACPGPEVLERGVYPWPACNCTRLNTLQAYRSWQTPIWPQNIGALPGGIPYLEIRP